MTKKKTLISQRLEAEVQLDEGVNDEDEHGRSQHGGS